MATLDRLSNKEICSLMYRDQTSGGRTCNGCNTFIFQDRSRGYHNLISHLRRHPDYERVLERCVRQRIPVTMDMFVDKDSRTTHGWMKLVVLKDLPFSSVDDDVFREAVKYNKINSKTLLARMKSCVELMEPAIIEELKSQQYVLIFDGLTDSAQHSLAVFVATKTMTRFLALSTFVDETSMSADEHIQFLDMILDHYKLDLSNLVAVVCANMNTNCAISKRTGVPMIGCASHRFNLAVQDHIKASMPLIKKIATLQRKLKTVKRIAILRRNGCKLKPVPLHEIRWSGVFRLLRRYEELQPYLHLFVDDTQVERDLPKDVPDSDYRRKPIVDFLPSAEEHVQIMQLLEDLKILDSTTQKLQTDKISLSLVRDIFDELLLEFPEMKTRLSTEATIIQSKDFERAVVKVQNNQDSVLTTKEAATLAGLIRPEIVAARAAKSASKKAKRRRIQEEPETNLETSGKKRRRTGKEVMESINIRAALRVKEASIYSDLTWLPATSVQVERLFSKIKCMLGYLRKSISHETLETLLYLKMNWDLVTDEVISNAVKRAVEDDNEEEADL